MKLIIVRGVQASIPQAPKAPSSACACWLGPLQSPRSKRYSASKPIYCPISLPNGIPVLVQDAQSSFRQESQEIRGECSASEDVDRIPNIHHPYHLRQGETSNLYRSPKFQMDIKSYGFLTIKSGRVILNARVLLDLSPSEIITKKVMVSHYQTS